MASTTGFQVAGYALAADRAYDPDGNLWVRRLGDGRVRVGYDPLGAETAGDIVAISFPAPGTRIARGEPFATVEAAKFVGPLTAPVGGVVAATSDEVRATPGRINADPLGSWLVELTDVDEVDMGLLLTGQERIAAWFASAVERFRAQGAIAE